MNKLTVDIKATIIDYDSFFPMSSKILTEPKLGLKANIS